MTLASDINTDLANMMGDWGDSISIGGTPYDGLYDTELVDTLDYQGYSPVFTLLASDVAASSVARGNTVQVTSVITGITSKAFTVRVIEPVIDGLQRLVLSE